MGWVRASLVAGLATAILGACGASQPVAERAQLKVIAQPQNASVYVDDRFVATARRLTHRPEPLRAGVHHVTISAPGHFPHDVEVELPSGLTTIEVELRPIPP